MKLGPCYNIGIVNSKYIPFKCRKHKNLLLQNDLHTSNTVFDVPLGTLVSQKTHLEEEKEILRFHCSNVNTRKSIHIIFIFPYKLHKICMPSSYQSKSSSLYRGQIIFSHSINVNTHKYMYSILYSHINIIKYTTSVSVQIEKGVQKENRHIL